eukprot:TRINITY_DN3643_c0_g1_i1.p1 TRINITY_DN3643_c0_g1~~TRINITY_DN3643_c0_g1_i1.p1  ORF type:complete len:582 (+),score=148.12 TRINITY_DN3643_c0_g1_i1:46-1746(+)
MSDDADRCGTGGSDAAPVDTSLSSQQVSRQQSSGLLLSTEISARLERTQAARNLAQQGADDGGEVRRAPMQSLARVIIDSSGRRWRRSERGLGAGTFGSVWRGLGEDGSFVALKAMPVPSPRSRRPGSRIRRQGAATHRVTVTLHLAARSSIIDHHADALVAGCREWIAAVCCVHLEAVVSACLQRATRHTGGVSIVTAVVNLPDARAPSDANASVKAAASPRAGEPVRIMGARLLGASSVPSWLDDLCREVSVLSKLRHDKIVGYLGSAVADGGLYGYVIVVMELLPGGCLATLLSDFGALPLAAGLRYTRDVLEGLAFLHGKGVAHRDFKPGNVLLHCDGSCKIADFGACVHIGCSPRYRAREVIGTPLYMSPEACRGEASCISDVWGVGVTFCELVTGAPPYPGGLLAQMLLYQIGRLQLLPRVPEDVPDNVAKFCQDCFTVDVGRRPPATALLSHPIFSDGHLLTAGGLRQEHEVKRDSPRDGMLRMPCGSRSLPSLPPVRSAAADADWLAKSRELPEADQVSSECTLTPMAEVDLAGSVCSREETNPQEASAAAHRGLELG